MDAFDVSTIAMIGNLVSMVGLLVFVPRMIERAMTRRLTAKVAVTEDTSKLVADAYSEGYDQALKDMRSDGRVVLPMARVHRS